MHGIMLSSLFFIVCFSTVIYCYSDCGSEVGTITSVVISGCNGTSTIGSNKKQRCILKRNTNASMELSFIPSTNATEITAVVHGVILGIPKQFSLHNSNGCENSGITCPLKAGQGYTYITTVEVAQIYPKVTVDIKWELKDQDQKNIVCALIPSKLG